MAENGRLKYMETIAKRFTEVTMAHRGEVKAIVTTVIGFTEFHNHLYELLIRSFKRKNVPSEKCLALLWQYRRLGHALCASPVSEGFITIFSQNYGKFTKSIKFWRSSMSGQLPLEVGFQQSFYFVLTNFSHGSCDTGYPFRPNVEVDEVKKAALNLTSKVPLCTSSIFLAAHLYHDWCGRMVSTGRIIEALSYAKDAHHLRSKLLKEKFRYSVEHQTEIYDENGAIIQKRCYCLSSFHMYSTIATAV